VKLDLNGCPIRGATRGAQFPGHRITTGAPNDCGAAEMSQSTFFNTVHLLPRYLRFDHGGAKPASCPGLHLTSLHLCVPFLHIRRRMRDLLEFSLFKIFHFFTSYFRIRRIKSFSIFGSDPSSNLNHVILMTCKCSTGPSACGRRDILVGYAIIAI